MVNHWGSFQEVPVKTAEAEEMSKALKKRGFSFVGKNFCEAFTRRQLLREINPTPDVFLA